MKTTVSFLIAVASMLVSPALFATNAVNVVDKGECDISIEVTKRDFLPEFTKATGEVLTSLCKEPVDPENFVKFLEALNIGIEEIVSTVNEDVSEGELRRLQTEVQEAAYDSMSIENLSAAEYSVPALGGVREDEVDGKIVIPEGEKTFGVVPNTVQCTAAIDDALDLTSEGELQQYACAYLFEQFVDLYGKMQGGLGKPALKAVSQYLAKNAKEWRRFRNEIKPQTPWEMGINRVIFIDDYSKYFKAPPSFQFVVAHPSVAYDIVPEAADGDQTTEAFVIEGLGMHWWGGDQWYIPSGFSVVAVYADRATQSDWRPGLALYFEETFTLGATRKDGDYGVFLSIDLVELVQDRGNLLNELGLGKIHEKLKGM